MKLIASLLALVAACTSLNAQTVNTVGQYDENAFNLNSPDIINVAAPLTYLNFNTAVSNGFLMNAGGVINFDQPQSITPYPAIGMSTLKAKYGIGGINLMLLSFGNPVNMMNTPGPYMPISHKGLLLQPVAAPLVFKLSPANGLPIRAVGFTLLQQQNPQAVKVEFIQAGGPIIPASQVVPIAAIPTKDVFFGRASTVVGGIVAVRISDFNANTGAPIPFAIDDLGFRQ